MTLADLAARAAHGARLAAQSMQGMRTNMPIFYHDCYTVALPEGHRFPMERYRATNNLLRSALASAPALPAVIEESRAASRSEIIAAHDEAFVDSYNNGTLPDNDHITIGFPWSKEFATRTATITGGTIQATEVALTCFRSTSIAPQGSNGSVAGDLSDSPNPSARVNTWIGPGGIACNQAGGTHHAFKGHGEGYCIFNDLAVAARWAQAQEQAHLGVKRVLVLDLDVHQGNGTAEIFTNDPSVVTFSMHGAKNYPWNSRRPSSMDIDVPDGAGDEVYLSMLRQSLGELESLLRKTAPKVDSSSSVSAGSKQDSRAAPGTPNDASSVAIDGVRVSGPDPSLGIQLVLYQAGVDPLAHDRLGRLKLTRSGLHERNDVVYRWCEAKGLPVVVTMGGGYSRPIELSAQCHVDVFLQAAQSWARRAAAYQQLFVGASGASYSNTALR